MEIRELTGDEVTALEKGLELAAKVVDQPGPLTVSAVQELYDALLKSETDFATAYIALGLSFGQLIAHETGYEWVRVSDEYGEETCLSPIGTQIICAPISMIQKRLKRGDHVNLVELRDETIRVVSSRVDSGEYGIR